MTEQDYIKLIDEVARLYNVAPVTLLNWDGLMPLAIEHEVNISHGFGTVTEAWFNNTGNDKFEHEFRETYADHPTKERAVAVAILKALKAKKEK